MRIIYFSRDYTPHDFRFLSALGQTRHKVAFLRLENNGRNLETRSLPSGVINIPWIGGKTPACWWDTLRLLADLKHVIEAYQPDVIHAGPLQSPAFLVALAGFRPLVSMSWGYDLLFDADRNAGWRWATRFTLKHTSVMVGDCETIRRRAKDYGMADERIVIFPWGIDLARFNFQRKMPGSEKPFHESRVTSSPTLEPCSTLRQHLGWSKDNFVILSTRNWSPLYGVDGLARAFVKVAAKHPELRLLLLGDGPQSPLIRQILSDGGVLDRVHLAGQKQEQELPQYYQMADLYVSTSHSDGTSISLLEAMACGCAVLLSDIPGNREWVSQETSNPVGWLFRDGDEAALAEGILNAYANRGNLSEIGWAARQLVELRGDWTKNFPKLLQAYEMAQGLL